MNNTRRKSIQNILDQLYDLQSRIEDLYNEEQETLDNIPENLQGSERYEMTEEAVGNLDEANEAIYNVIEYLEHAQE